MSEGEQETLDELDFAIYRIQDGAGGGIIEAIPGYPTARADSLRG